MNMVSQVETYIKKEDMLRKGDQIIIGLSGGADSVCLFFVLCALRQEYGFALEAVHVNHQIRGNAAEEDERFCRQLCEKYEVPLTVVRENVPARAKEWGVSEEEAGRKIRYEAFEKKKEELLRKKEREACQVKIAVAHHQNDQAETVLWHICRGTDLSGLVGIRGVRDSIIRPLLCVSRAEIEGYLEELEQEYCTDQTNFENEYTRNRIRNVILPQLEQQINQKVREHLVELSDTALLLEDYVTRNGEQIYEEVVEERPGEIRIGLDRFIDEHEVIQRYVVKKALQRITKRHKDITRQHIMMILGLVNKQVGKRCCLPFDIIVSREYGALVFEKRQMENTHNTTYGLRMDGENRIKECGILLQTRVFQAEELGGFWEDRRKKIPKNNCTKWFDYDKIEGTVEFRSMKNCDAIQIDQQGHQKLLKRVCMDAKISAKEREKLFVVADQERVLWLPRVRDNFYYRIDENTERILEITIGKGDLDECENVDFQGRSREKD